MLFDKRRLLIVPKLKKRKLEKNKVNAHSQETRKINPTELNLIQQLFNNCYQKQIVTSRLMLSKNSNEKQTGNQIYY
jgi:hypothetical protein